MEYCPFCNSDKGFEFRLLSDYVDECYSMNLSNPDVYKHNGRMFVSECLACGRLIISDDFGGQLPPELFDKAEVIYPKTLLTHEAIPEEIRLTYESAKRIQQLNSEAFAVAIRKCVEITCKLHGIKKGTLADKFKKLCSQLSIPGVLAEAGNSIRLIGNQAAHELEGVHPVNSYNIDNFFRILMEYIYILPAKLEWFKHINSIEEGKEGPLITIDGRWVVQKGKHQGWTP